jgi:hypothetical protein
MLMRERGAYERAREREEVQTRERERKGGVESQIKEKERGAGDRVRNCG